MGTAEDNIRPHLSDISQVDTHSPGRLIDDYQVRWPVCDK